MPFSLRRHTAFTLAELLISLVVLGIIATFTIPKVLQAQQSGQYNSEFKETAAMVTNAYKIYQQQHSGTVGMTGMDLTPYMNYVQTSTSSAVVFDGLVPSDCSYFGPAGGGNGGSCFILHNSGTLGVFGTPYTLATSETTSALYFVFDPSTSQSGSAPIGFFVYYSGRITTFGTIDPKTCIGNGFCYANPIPLLEPPWLSWS